MKQKKILLFPATLLIAGIGFPTSANAADIYKYGTTGNLNLLNSWSTASSATQTAPASFNTNDNWYFNNVALGATSGTATLALGANTTMGGIAVDTTEATGSGTPNIVITGNTLTLNGGTLGGQGVAGTGYSNAGIVLNRATGSNGGTLTINSNINVGATQQWVTSRNLTIGGNVNLGANNLDLFSAGGTVTINGNITGTGNLARTNSGGGAVVLAGTNSYTGSTTVNLGNLQISGSTNTGAGTITVGSGSAATLTINTGGSFTTTGNMALGSGATGNSLSIASGASVSVGSISNPWATSYTVNGSLTSAGGWTISTNAAAAITGSGNISATSLTLGNAGGTNVNYSGTGKITLSGNLNLNSSGSGAGFNQSAGTVNVAGITWANGNNHYTLSGGRLNLGAGGISATGGSGRTVSLGAGTVGALAGWSSAQGMALTDAATGVTFNTLDATDNTTARAIALSGNLTGTGGLNKAGAGTLTLSGAANSYAGATNVTGGTLLVNGANTGTGLVTVSSGATLGGTGSLAANVTVNGTLSPGASIESLATGAVSFTNGSTFAYELTTDTVNGDLLVANGGLNLGGTVNLTFSDLGSITTVANDTILTLINYSGAWNGGLFTYGGNELADGETFSLNGQDWIIDYNSTADGSNFAGETGYANFVNITAIPEPGAALLGSLGVLALLRRRRD